MNTIRRPINIGTTVARHRPDLLPSGSVPQARGIQRDSVRATHAYPNGKDDLDVGANFRSTTRRVSPSVSKSTEPNAGLTRHHEWCGVHFSTIGVQALRDEAVGVTPGHPVPRAVPGLRRVSQSHWGLSAPQIRPGAMSRLNHWGVGSQRLSSIVSTRP